MTADTIQGENETLNTDKVCVCVCWTGDGGISVRAEVLSFLLLSSNSVFV